MIHQTRGARVLRLCLCGVVLGLLAGCQPQAPVSKRAGDAGDFKGAYLSARTALETGRYARALRGYEGLLNRAGPLEPRLRLEYAHTLLRIDRFAAAADEARAIAATQSGTARLAALAVQGTADHEAARVALAQGDRGSSTRARLQAAQTALSEVIKAGANLDPLGALEKRHQAVTATLSSL